jgi:RNA recognition motif-containing protein
MGSPEEAQKAIDAMHGKPLDGRNLTVNIARPKEERTGGGGGGGRPPRRDYGGGGERRERY